MCMFMKPSGIPYNVEFIQEQEFDDEIYDHIHRDKIGKVVSSNYKTGVLQIAKNMLQKVIQKLNIYHSSLLDIMFMNKQFPRNPEQINRPAILIHKVGP